MISYRSADILKKVREQKQNDMEFATPTNGLKPSRREPDFDDEVDVHDPILGEDDWKHHFYGHIEDFIEEGTNGKPKIYIIKDQDDDVWQMTRDKFDLVDAVPVMDATPMTDGDLLVGESVYVKDSEDHGPDENWYGRIKLYNPTTKLYTVEDKVGDEYEMTREKFEVQ